MDIMGTSSSSSDSNSKFALFPDLPPEIRSQIWKAALTPRIIKWTRNFGKNVFTTASKSPFLTDVCQESREVALLYGEYIDINMSIAATPLYFSPLIDYLMFDPRWQSLPIDSPLLPFPNPLESLPPELFTTRKIMVHPNYTDERKHPTTRCETLLQLEQLLVVADEKSIGSQSKFMLGTIYDITKYYEVQKKRTPSIKIPHIAIGCLGWTGAERRKMHHGKEDDRKLVAVFENEAEMKVHLNSLREEEWRFTQELKHTRIKFNLKMKSPVASESPRPAWSVPDYQDIPVDPPAYSEVSPTLVL